MKILTKKNSHFSEKIDVLENVSKLIIANCNRNKNWIKKW